MGNKKTATSANDRKNLRPIKKGERIVYGGGGFHIKKVTKKKK